MNTARIAHTATLLQDHTVLVAGGTDGVGNAFASAEIFDPSAGAFTSTGSMTTTRFAHTATLLGDGTVRIAGGDKLVLGSCGINCEMGFPQSSAFTELFNPASGSFSPAADMEAARANHTATLLGSGQVLVTGGVFSRLEGRRDLSEVLSSAELLQ
jgi:hypothetical protein